MDIERKKKLLNYLFPTEEAREFVCNNFFDELSLIIKPTFCICYNNITVGVKKRNKEIVKDKIKNFLSGNNFYLNKLSNLYSEKSIDKLTDDMLIGYVFYISVSSTRYNSFDIFKDRRSICYEPISIIDML